jgi:hypothetical protein
MRVNRLKRRVFLQGAGGALMALPFLESLLSREVRAQNAAPPRRLIAIKSYSTQNIRDFYPSRAVSGYTLRKYGGDESGGGNGKEDGTLALSQPLAESSGRHSNGTSYTGKWAPLVDFAGEGFSRILGPTLDPFASKMLVLRGLDFLPDTNHNDGGMLGYYKGGSISDTASSLKDVPTIDQVLAYSPKVYANAPAARSLHLSPGRSNTFSFTDNGKRGGSITQVQADTNPKVVFDRLFKNFQAPSGGDAPSEDPNKMLVDRVIEDYRQLAKNPALGAADRETLERHVSLMAELEARLGGGSAGPSPGCKPPTAPPSVQSQGVDVATLRQSYGLMIDLLVAAVQCDLTRVVTLDVYKALGKSGGADQGFEHSCASCEGNPNPTDWHRAAHDWDQMDQRSKVISINEWIAREVFTPILEKLDVTESGDSTYLDNSVVFWGNELGMNHLNYSIPTVLAGSAGGYLKTGRYIDYIDWDRNVKFSQHNGMVIEGVPYNRLMATLLQAFGLEPSDYESDSGNGYGDTVTTGKPSDAFAVDYDMSAIGSVLPDIRA